MVLGWAFRHGLLLLLGYTLCLLCFSLLGPILYITLHQPADEQKTHDNVQPFHAIRDHSHNGATKRNEFHRIVCTHSLERLSTHQDIPNPFERNRREWLRFSLALTSEASKTNIAQSRPPNPMVDMQQFENIKQKYGQYASWAVWTEVSEKPKSNMGDVSCFKNESVLSLLKNDVVMVGLNFARPVSPVSGPFTNFHSSYPWANDFKIRYAFKDSPYYGAYMTDIIKSFVEVDAKRVMKHLKEHPETIQENLKTFREEMHDLKGEVPVILAFGKDTHKLLSENLNRNEYCKLIRLTHYSHQVGKETYKETVFKQIESQMLTDN